TLLKMSEDTKKFTPDDKDEYDDDPDVLRAMLSCGHITDPQTLTDCCRAQLDAGNTEFRCPLCEDEWPYDEVRKLAKLTVDEKCNFEDMMGTKAAEKLCPGCDSFIDRLDVSNLCVECSICTKRNGQTYEFCWQCVREWKGPRPRGDRCGNVGCTSADQELLRDCPLIYLKSVKNIQCPSIRACIFCGVLIEHTNEGCKIMKCKECNKQFCFICLKPAQECLENTNHFNSCSAGLAPRQIDSDM
uniref:RING-type domain-containing protein n=1 Tax=Sinocyclocheilus anshuiensis TaxID=1608454 RepID=A0A671PKD3_9TELE